MTTIKLVAHGKLPYLDFFYQNMPGLPYAYALWSKAVGLSWTSARLLSVLCSAALGGLLYWHTERLYCKKTLACLAVLLYALNNLVLAWQSVVKTYALSNLLLFCAYLLVFTETRQESYWKAFSSGLLLALAVDTRLYLISVTPVMMASLYYSGARSGRHLKYLGLFVGGLALGLFPNLLFLSRGTDPYLFDNVGFHFITGSAGFLARIRQRIEIFLAITNVQGSHNGSGAQFALLGLPALAILPLRDFDRRLFFPFAMGFVLFVSCLVPSPSFTQYFCACVPYMVILTIEFTVIVSRSLEFADAAVRWVRMLGLLVAGLYVSCGVLTIYNYSFSATGVEGIEWRGNSADHRISTVRQVSRELGHLVSKEEPVMSFWPGYVVECDCGSLKGMENDWARWMSRKLTPVDADRRKILTDAEVENLLQMHYPRAVVVRSGWFEEAWGRAFRDTLRRNGYTPVRSIGKAEIYTIKRQ